jgi:hypothetical protein
MDVKLQRNERAFIINNEVTSCAYTEQQALIGDVR